MGCDCFGKMVESMYLTIRVKLLKKTKYQLVVVYTCLYNIYIYIYYGSTFCEKVMPIISMSGRDTMEDGAWEVQCNHHIRQLGAHQDHISGFHCDLSTCSNGDPQVCLMRDLCRMCKWWRHRVNLYFCWVISKHECGFVYLDWLSTMFDIFFWED